MTTKTRLLALIFAALFLSGLAGCLPPAPNPKGKEPAAVGISVENRWESMSSFGQTPEWVHFVRWNDDDDITAQKEIVTSNFFRGNRAYLLNAKPGRYAVIATTEIASNSNPSRRQEAVAGAARVARRPRAQFASFRGPSRFLIQNSSLKEQPGADEIYVQTTFLDEAMIRRTLTEVKPGQFVFMGSLVLDRDRKGFEDDQALTHFFPLRNPALLDHLGLLVIPTDISTSRGTALKIERGKEAEAAFLASAVGDLRGSEWGATVQRALDILAEK